MIHVSEKRADREKPADDSCGLCGAVTPRDEAGIPYIICQPCYRRFLKVSSVYRKQLDELPFGVIDLDSNATVLAYNRTEANLARLQAENVIGKNFFTEVAPCTAVQEFQGRFHEFMLGRERTMRFNFTFGFKHGPVEVEIFFLRGSDGDDLNSGERSARIIVKRVRE